MPFPNVQNKYEGKAILTPQHMVAYRQKEGMLPKGAAPLAALLCLQRGLPERLARKHPYRKIGRLNGDLYSLKKTDGKVVVLSNFGLGSPLMAGIAEELIAWGVQRLLSLSMCGALQPDLKAGDIVVCNQAIRDEGTSHHYLPSEKYVSANAKLAGEILENLNEAGERPQLGTTWTTDATYRETDIEVRHYQAEGVKTVEMETAALYAVAQVRGVPAASVFVVGDQLANAEWRAPAEFRTIDRSFEAVYAAIIDVLNAV
jgi:uridine phosphorylase